MDNFEQRNEKAWASINAEKAIQAELRIKAGLEPTTDVEIFCRYLEEVAMELRSTPLTIKYLAAVCQPLIEHTEIFWTEQNEKNRLKIATDYKAQRGIEVPVDTNPPE